MSGRETEETSAMVTDDFKGLGGKQRGERRGQESTVALSPAKLLFVDDEEINCINFRLNFEDEYQVITACSGEEALRILAREEDIAVLLTDQRMTGMTGVELCVASLKLRPDCLRWIVTAYADLDDILAGINQAHIQYYILKPWDTEQVRLLLLQAVQSRNLARVNRVLEEDLRWRNEQLNKTNDKLREAENRLRALSASLIEAQESERRRIALELHDELGQELTALKLGLRLLETSFLGEKGTEGVSASFTELRQQLNRVMENVRRLSQDLSPIQIENLGLDSAMISLIENTAARCGLELDGSRMPIGHLYSMSEQRLIYRMLQEALNNVAKHAAASRILVDIRRDDAGVSLRVEDDGQGFIPAAPVAAGPGIRGMGLTALQERAHMLGGCLQLDSGPGLGTRLEILLPLPQHLSGPA